MKMKGKVDGCCAPTVVVELKVFCRVTVILAGKVSRDDMSATDGRVSRIPVYLNLY